MIKSLFLTAYLLLILVGNRAYGQQQAIAAEDETQVLIDVSGSMKQNDPKNLRIQAAQLLISLLPEKSKATVWLFAEKTALLTNSDAVDSAWKKQALHAASGIHSRGLYTHIEDAIQTVLKNGFAGKGGKHLVILTDGMVDISKDIMVSADSRERILSEWIPRLQQQNIQVLTVALSDQADKELLEKLAFDTGGWTQVAESAEQLQKAFLRMAQKAAPKDGLPLVGNQFAVDASIKEFSVLAFKKTPAAASRLLSPSKQAIDKHSRISTVSWLETPGYDLISIRQPEAGNWVLEAEADPDNQVMIVTDLKMQLDELPNFIADKEAVALKTHFTDQGKLINRKDFLGLLTVTAAIDAQPPVALRQSAGEPAYFVMADLQFGPGKHSLKLVADGKTFKREILRELEVVASAIRVEKSVDADKRQVTIKLQPDPALLDSASLAIEASVNRAGLPAEKQALAAKDNVWAVTVDNLPPGSETTVNFAVLAKSRDGKPVSPDIKPVKLDDSLFPQAQPPQAQAVAEPAAHQEAASAEQAAAHEATAPPQAEEPSRAGNESSPPATAADWLEISLIVLAVNLVLIGGGFFVYRALNKAREKKHQQILEKLS